MTQKRFQELILKLQTSKANSHIQSIYKNAEKYSMYEREVRTTLKEFLLEKLTSEQSDELITIILPNLD
jgi:hypothetical protein